MPTILPTSNDTPERRALLKALNDKFSASLAAFHSDECEALLRRYAHIENLIGEQHQSPTEGDFCEVLLRQFLRDVIPQNYSVDTGFVRGSPAQVRDPSDKVLDLIATPQIDILIHDTHQFSPVFRYGDVVIVLPESVMAVIEVKKTLSTGSLKEALSNLLGVRLMVNNRNCLVDCERVFMGVFAFSEDMTIPQDGSLTLTFENRFNESATEAGNQHLLPDAVIAAGGHACLRRAERDANKPAEIAIWRTAKDGRQYATQILLSKMWDVMHLPETLARVNRFAFPAQLDFRKTINIEPLKQPEPAPTAPVGGKT